MLASIPGATYQVRAINTSDQVKTLYDNDLPDGKVIFQPGEVIAIRTPVYLRHCTTWWLNRAPAVAEGSVGTLAEAPEPVKKARKPRKKREKKPRGNGRPRIEPESAEPEPAESETFDTEAAEEAVTS